MRFTKRLARPPRIFFAQRDRQPGFSPDDALRMLRSNKSARDRMMRTGKIPITLSKNVKGASDLHELS